MEKKKYDLPIDLFGIECGKGWKCLYEPIIEWIKNYNIDKEKEQQIEIHQIKEKFGGLRFYCNFYTDELKEIIRKAEQESFRVCEFCGTKENVGHTISGWYMTCCEQCISEMSVKNKREYKWKSDSDGETKIIKGYV